MSLASFFHQLSWDAIPAEEVDRVFAELYQEENVTALHVAELFFNKQRTSSPAADAHVVGGKLHLLEWALQRCEKERSLLPLLRAFSSPYQATVNSAMLHQRMFDADQELYDASQSSLLLLPLARAGTREAVARALNLDDDNEDNEGDVQHAAMTSDFKVVLKPRTLTAHEAELLVQQLARLLVLAESSLEDSAQSVMVLTFFTELAKTGCKCGHVAGLEQAKALLLKTFLSASWPHRVKLVGPVLQLFASSTTTSGNVEDTLVRPLLQHWRDTGKLGDVLAELPLSSSVSVLGVSLVLAPFGGAELVADILSSSSSSVLLGGPALAICQRILLTASTSITQPYERILRALLTRYCSEAEAAKGTSPRVMLTHCLRVLLVTPPPTGGDVHHAGIIQVCSQRSTLTPLGLVMLQELVHHHAGGEGGDFVLELLDAVMTALESMCGTGGDDAVSTTLWEEGSNGRVQAVLQSSGASVSSSYLNSFLTSRLPLLMQLFRKLDAAARLSVIQEQILPSLRWEEEGHDLEDGSEAAQAVLRLHLLWLKFLDEVRKDLQQQQQQQEVQLAVVLKEEEGDVKFVRGRIARVLPVCDDVGDMHSLLALCDAVPVVTPAASSSALSAPELVCWLLERCSTADRLVCTPGIAQVLVQLATTASSSSDGLLCIGAVCARIERACAIATLDDDKAARTLVHAVLQRMFSDYEQQSLDLLAAVLNMPADKCAVVKRIMCLLGTRGATTEAFELLLWQEQQPGSGDAVIQLDVDAIEAADDGQEDEEDDEDEYDEYDDEEEEEDSDMDDDYENEDARRSHRHGKEVFKAVSTLWRRLQSSCTRVRRSPAAQVANTISALIKCANALSSYGSAQALGDAEVHEFVALLARVARSARLSPSRFPRIFHTSTEVDAAMKELTRFDHLALLRFVGSQRAVAQLAVRRPRLMTAVVSAATQLQGVVPPLEEADRAALWNVLVAALDQSCAPPALLIALSTLLVQQPSSTGVAVDTQKLFDACFNDFVSFPTVAAKLPVLQLLIALAPLQDLLAKLSLVPRDLHSATALVLHQLLLSQCSATDDRVRVMESALRRCNVGGTDADWLQWIESVAFPPPPSGDDAAAATSGGGVSEDESFAQLVDFVAAKRQALAASTVSAARAAAIAAAAVASSASMGGGGGGALSPHHHLLFQEIFGGGGGGVHEEEDDDDDEHDHDHDDESSSDEEGGAAHHQPKVNEEAMLNMLMSSRATTNPPAPAAAATAVIDLVEDTCTATNTPLAEEVQRRARPALLGLVPEFMRCCGPTSHGQALRCVQCGVNLVCGVCAETCHAGHDVELVLLSSNKQPTAVFACACGEDCEGKQPRREMQREPVEYLRGLLLGQNLAASAPVPAAASAAPEFVMVKPSQLRFDVSKGGGVAERCGVSPRKLAHSSGYPTLDVFAVCEGTCVSIVDLAPVLTTVRSNSTSSTSADGKQELVSLRADSSGDAEDEVLLTSLGGLAFHIVQVEFSPPPPPAAAASAASTTTTYRLLLSGAHQCACLELAVHQDSEMGEDMHELVSNTSICELTNEFVKRSLWLSSTLVCVVMTSRIQVHDLLTGRAKSYRAHGEILVDAAVLETDTTEEEGSLILLCKSGCVLQHRFSSSSAGGEEEEGGGDAMMEEGAEEEEDDAGELMLYKYVVFHPNPIPYIVSSLTRLSSRAFLIHSSQGSWRVDLDGDSAAVGNALVLHQTHFDTSFQPCLAVRSRRHQQQDDSDDVVLVAPSCSVRVPSSLSFTSLRKAKTSTPVTLFSPSRAADRVVGLVDWRDAGERIVMLLESGYLAVYAAVHSQPPSMSVPQQQPQYVARLLQHAEPVRRPAIYCKSATRTLTSTTLVRQKDARRILLGPFSSSSTPIATTTSFTKDGNQIQYSGREMDVNLGLADPTRTICAVRLLFGMEHVPRRILLFGRSIALGMKHAELTTTTTDKTSATVQIVLLPHELVLARQQRGVRLTLMPTTLAGMVVGTVGIKSLDVFSLADERIDECMENGGGGGGVFSLPGRFNDNREGHLAALQQLNNLRAAGRAAFRFPLATVPPALVDKARALVEKKQQGDALARLALARACGLDTFAGAAWALFDQEEQQSATSAALLALFHCPIAKPVEPQVQLQESYSCDLCGEFPIRSPYRWSCSSCADFDACEDCARRPPVLHDPAHVWQRMETPAADVSAAAAAIVGPEQLCAALLARAVGPPPPLEMMRFVLLSCAIPARVGGGGSVTAANQRQAREVILAVADSDWQLQAMALAEEYSPGALFTAEDVDRVLERIVASSSSSEQQQQQQHMVAKLLPGIIDVCRSNNNKPTAGGKRMELLRLLLSVAFEVLPESTRRRAFDLLQPPSSAAHERQYNAFALSCRVLGLMRKLSQLVSGGDSGTFLPRSTLVQCREVLDKLKRELVHLPDNLTVHNNEVVMIKVPIANRRQAVGTLVRVAEALVERELDPAACVELLTGLFAMSAAAAMVNKEEEEGALLDARAVAFLVDKCLLHPTNAWLRQVTRTALALSREHVVAGGGEDALKESFDMAARKCSSVSVDCIMLFACKQQQQQQQPTPPALAELQLVLAQLERSGPLLKAKWTPQLPLLRYVRHALPTTATYSATSLLLNNGGGGCGGVCIDCVGMTAPLVEPKYAVVSLDATAKATYESYSAQYKLMAGDVCDIKTISVDFTSHLSSSSGISGGASAAAIAAAAAAIRRAAAIGGSAGAAAAAAAPSSAWLQEIKVFVGLETPSSSPNSTTTWELVGRMDKFVPQYASSRTLTAKLDLDACVVQGNLIKFEFVLHKTALVDQRCPRCAKPVPATGRQDVACGTCGEMLNQCRQCRSINYGDAKALLCTQCGFCRLAKFSFAAQARPSWGRVANQAKSQAEFERARQVRLFADASQREEAQFDTLGRVRAPALRSAESFNLSALAQDVAAPELELAYSAASLASAEAGALRRSLAEFRFPGDKAKQFAVSVQDKREGTAAGCLDCELAHFGALLAALPLMCSGGGSNESVQCVVAALPSLVDCAETLAALQDFLPKYDAAMLALMNGGGAAASSSSPLVDLVVALITTALSHGNNGERVLQPVLDRLQGKANAFAVDTAELLAVALWRQQPQTSGAATAAKDCLAVLEHFIRRGVEVPRSILALKRFAALPPATAEPAARISPAKRMRRSTPSDDDE